MTPDTAGHQDLSASPAPPVEGPMARISRLAFPWILTAFALFYIWSTFQVTAPPRNTAIGPRTFPFLVGAAMVAVCVAILFRERMERRRSVADASSATDTLHDLEEEDDQISDWLAFWVVVISILLFFIALVPLGYLVSTTLFIFCTSTYFAPQKWYWNLPSALLFSFVTFTLFTKGLGILLPPGILPVVPF